MKRILIVKQTRGLPIRAGWKSVEDKKGTLMIGDITKAIEDEKPDGEYFLEINIVRSTLGILDHLKEAELDLSYKTKVILTI